MHNFICLESLFGGRTKRESLTLRLLLVSFSKGLRFFSDKWSAGWCQREASNRSGFDEESWRFDFGRLHDQHQPLHPARHHHGIRKFLRRHAFCTFHPPVCSRLPFVRQQSLSKKTVMVVTSKLDIIKSSDFIIYFKDGELQSGNYKKLMSESPRFRSLVARAEVDKVVSDSQPGVPVITGHTNKIRSRNNIGFSSDEMIANEVDISSMTKRNRFSYGFEKGKEVQTISCRVLATSTVKIFFSCFRCIIYIFLYRYLDIK